MERTTSTNGHDGYGIASPDDVDGSAGSPPARHASFAEPLGCTNTAVDAYRLRTGDCVSLPTGREAVCVSLDAPVDLTVETTRRVPRSALVRIPAGAASVVRAETATTWLVLGAATDPAPERRPVVVPVGDLEFAVPATSDVRTARLTDRLGCRGMKANVRRLRPGDAVPYHTEGSQEELFVPLDGPGSIRIAGSTYHLDRGDVVRVAPTVPRGATNDGDRDRLWLMVGAPPTGGADEWDPGAESVAWPGPEPAADDGS